MSTDHFDKYFYYKNSVQEPESDCLFIDETFTSLRGYSPNVVREDFCGTFSFCCEWVKKDPKNIAYGLDIDEEPINYGKEKYLSEIPKDAQERVKITKGDVLQSNLPPVQVICALNFSYFIFKERAELKAYFESAYKSLSSDGIFILDCFGGSQCYEANEEETEDEELGYSYFWDQDSYNPVNNHGMFYIHFQRTGEEKREKVFSYDWRIWSLAELKDILSEVGFSSSQVYWEGTDEDGDGDGLFTPTEKGEECESWIAYMVAKK